MKKNLKAKAFSLIELSIVILVIGIIIAGVIQSSRLVRVMRLASARSLTSSSDVNSIPNLVTWLETTKEESLKESEEEDGLTINNWYDINPQKSLKNNAQQLSPTANLHPTYLSNCINGLPCLKFNGATSFMNTTQVLGSTTGMSIFVVMKLSSVGATDNTTASIIATSGWTTGYDFNFRAYSNNRVGNQLAGAVGDSYSSTSMSFGQPSVAAVIDSGTTSTSYLNKVGGTPVSIAAAGITKFLSLLEIGAFSGTGTRVRYLDGHISEIIIFDRALSTDERQSVENYLYKKWGIK